MEKSRDDGTGPPTYRVELGVGGGRLGGHGRRFYIRLTFQRIPRVYIRVERMNHLRNNIH